MIEFDICNECIQKTLTSGCLSCKTYKYKKAFYELEQYIQENMNEKLVIFTIPDMFGMLSNLYIKYNNIVEITTTNALPEDTLCITMNYTDFLKFKRGYGDYNDKSFIY